MAALVERLPTPPAPDPAQALADGQALGWLGLGLPENLGGAGGFEDLTIVHEELGRGLAPSLVTTLGLAGRVLLQCDPGPVRDHVLAGVCAGTALVGTALRPGFTLTDGRLNGSQRHVVDARTTRQLLVVAQDSSGAEQLVLLSCDAPGVELEDEPGLADVPQCRVTLQGVAVGQPFLTADSATVLRAVRREATTLAAARAVGGGRAVLARTIDHVKTRHQFDRPIGTFQAVQHQLADVATALDGAGLAVARAVWAVESAPEEADAAAAIAGLAATKAFADATLVAHQLHGGMGFVLDSPLHLWSARAVADPTAPAGSRGRLLDVLGSALGLAPEGFQAPPSHRLSPAPLG